MGNHNDPSSLFFTIPLNIKLSLNKIKLKMHSIELVNKTSVLAWSSQANKISIKPCSVGTMVRA